jgi:phosphoribosyl-AMP cyclohydrolase / phosphoribosyl-ATP pyrophosphohydrolase
MTNLNFEKLNGLIPAIVQDYTTGQVLMLGFMNREALEITKQTGFVTFYSRTRRQIWTKGETSRNYLTVQSITPDCDGDTLLISAIPQGPVCHTGNATCFGNQVTSNVNFLEKLESIIESKKNEQIDDSYTAKLLNLGSKRIAKKLGEEAVELALEAENGTVDRLIDEAADLMYHLQVLLVSRGLSISDVTEKLKQRHLKTKSINEMEESFVRGEKIWSK